MRAQVEISRYIRKIEFTEPVKRRLIDEVKDIVERVSKRAARARRRSRKTLNLKTRKPKLKEEEKKNADSSGMKDLQAPRSSSAPRISRRAPSTCATRSK